MIIDDSFYMNLAIDEAWKYQLLAYPNPAVGSAVVKAGRLLCVEVHKEAGSPHAEVLALKEAFLKSNPKSSLQNLETSHEIHDFLIKNHNGYFNDCEVYVTLEPCAHVGRTPSCAYLLSILKPKRVIIATIDPNPEASGGYGKLKEKNIEVVLGVAKQKATDLLYPFIKWQQNNFKFFKMAMRLNGSIDGGYITSKESLKYVHQIRDKLDLLVIGGNTVRTDSPTLDSRLVNGKAPDIKILSMKKEFDRTIPLFNIKNRNVEIIDNIKKINNKSFIMIEGGYSLLKEVINEIDMLLVFVSSSMKNGLNAEHFCHDFEFIHTNNIGQDTLFWLKI